MSWFACLYGCSSHKRKETPTDPLSVLYPSLPESVGQMSGKPPHLAFRTRLIIVILRNTPYPDTIQTLWALLKSALLSSVSRKSSWVALQPNPSGIVGLCKNIFKITAEHHVKCCLTCQRSDCPSASRNKQLHTFIPLWARNNTSDMHLWEICVHAVHGQFHIALYHAEISAYSCRNTGID